jgi:hypothetical protein
VSYSGFSDELRISVYLNGKWHSEKLVDIDWGHLGPSFQIALSSNRHVARKHGPIMRKDDTTSRGNPSTLKGVHQWAKRQVWVALSEPTKESNIPSAKHTGYETLLGIGKSSANLTHDSGLTRVSAALASRGPSGFQSELGTSPSSSWQ